LKTLRFLVVSCLAFAAVAAPARAANIVLGNPLTETFSSSEIKAPTTFVNLRLESGNRLVSPVEGLIVSWAVKGASPGPFALRVLAPAGPLAFTGAGRSLAATPAGTGLERFGAALPIKAGQTIGLDSPAATATIGASPSTPNSEFAVAGMGVLGEGQTTAFEAGPGADIAFNAEVQPAPTVASLGTTSGPLAGGTGVLITGSDLEGVTSVRFGGTAAVFGQVSDGAVLATSPPGAAAIGVPILVTTRAGTGASSQLFTYVGPPPPPTAKTCIVPKLAGKKLRAAKQQIRSHHCRVGNVTKPKGITAKDGKVVHQSPRPGAGRPPEAKVSIRLG
jgi:hypothetical protein